MKAFDALAERFGLNAYALGRFDVAEKWFRRLEKNEGESIRVLRNLGVILLARGDIAGAERYLRREEQLYGVTFVRLRSLADLCYTTGKREEAGTRYAAALAESEAASLAEGNRSFLEARLDICRDAARFDSSRRSAAHFAEGEKARDSGRPEEALSAFLAAAEEDPTNWPALNNAGVVWMAREGGAAQALELFRKAASCVRVAVLDRNIALAEQALSKGLSSGSANKKPGRKA